jgi:hypothetical protein
VLLDALIGLKAHADSLILVGAQAVYLRTGDGDIAVAPYTVDGDLALDPRALGDDPKIDAAMEAAGFQHRIVDEHPEPGIWVAWASVGGERSRCQSISSCPRGSRRRAARAARGSDLTETGPQGAQRV